MVDKLPSDEFIRAIGEDIGVLPKKPYKDPTCPKCGIVLGNKMMYCCPHFHCPVGLN
jgi:hypothetical protein